jgi:hypothetical protein
MNMYDTWAEIHEAFANDTFDVARTRHDHMKYLSLAFTLDPHQFIFHECGFNVEKALELHKVLPTRAHLAEYLERFQITSKDAATSLLTLSTPECDD